MCAHYMATVTSGSGCDMVAIASQLSCRCSSMMICLVDLSSQSVVLASQSL